jgi:hypothetical protein
MNPTPKHNNMLALLAAEIASAMEDENEETYVPSVSTSASSSPSSGSSVDPVAAVHDMELATTSRTDAFVSPVGKIAVRISPQGRCIGAAPFGAAEEPIVPELEACVHIRGWDELFSNDVNNPQALVFELFSEDTPFYGSALTIPDANWPCVRWLEELRIRVDAAEFKRQMSLSGSVHGEEALRDVLENAACVPWADEDVPTMGNVFFPFPGCGWGACGETGELRHVCNDPRSPRARTPLSTMPSYRIVDCTYTASASDEWGAMCDTATMHTSTKESVFVVTSTLRRAFAWKKAYQRADIVATVLHSSPAPNTTNNNTPCGGTYHTQEWVERTGADRGVWIATCSHVSNPDLWGDASVPEATDRTRLRMLLANNAPDGERPGPWELTTKWDHVVADFVGDIHPSRRAPWNRALWRVRARLTRTTLMPERCCESAIRAALGAPTRCSSSSTHEYGPDGTRRRVPRDADLHASVQRFCEKQPPQHCTLTREVCVTSLDERRRLAVARSIDAGDNGVAEAGAFARPQLLETTWVWDDTGPCDSSSSCCCCVCATRPSDCQHGCGHRTCAECSVRCTTCPECRAPLTHRSVSTPRRVNIERAILGACLTRVVCIVRKAPEGTCVAVVTPYHAANVYAAWALHHVAGVGPVIHGEDIQWDPQHTPRAWVVSPIDIRSAGASLVAEGVQASIHTVVCYAMGDTWWPSPSQNTQEGERETLHTPTHFAAAMHKCLDAATCIVINVV